MLPSNVKRNIKKSEFLNNWLFYCSLALKPGLILQKISQYCKAKVTNKNGKAGIAKKGIQ
jgi:hypothetical protein